MKFETIEEIISLIKSNPTAPAWIIKARDYNKELEALVNGKDFCDLLIKVEHKEDEKKILARRKYARSVKGMFEKLFKPLTNVYSATGGSKLYPENTPEEVLKQLSNIRDGKTLEKWLELNWMNNVYKTDPNGIIIYEWNKEKCYPVYKNISKIRNYLPNGQKCEWILFEPVNMPGKNKRMWRFIDDAFDYQFLEDNNNFVLDSANTFTNPFEIVPAMINSDIIELGSNFRKSPIHNIIEPAKEYLRDLSHKTIFKFLLWDPIFWRYAVKCNTCHGTGKKGTGDCPDCHKGYYINKDITDMVILPAPEDKEGMKLAPDIGGFIVPTSEIMSEFNKELGIVYNEMESILWGVTTQSELNVSNNPDKTAFQVYADIQPQITALNTYADSAEWSEQWLTILALKYYINPNIKGVSILYGRNYILENPSILLERYEKSKNSGDNTAILDKQLREWLLSKYKNDPQTLNNELNRLQIEPHIHYTIEQVQLVYGQEMAKKKMLFNQWWNEIDKKNKTPEQLQLLFNEYVLGALTEGKEKIVETLNGAQVTSMIELMTAIGQGLIPVEVTEPLIQAAFPTIPSELIQSIVAGLEKKKVIIPQN